MLTSCTKEVEALRIWYKRAKEIAIKAESMDLLNKAYLQPLHEFRYCLDHLMRSLDYEQEKKVKKLLKNQFFQR